MISDDREWLVLARNYLQFQVNAGLVEFLPVRVRANPQQQASLEVIRKRLEGCTRCPLHAHRRTIVFGEGNPHAQLMFIGEAPGADEDRQGRPFVGKAGQLLTRMIQAMNLRREDVYIANTVKCRPPRNRTPAREEIDTCLPFLDEQIQTVGPKVIIALGKVAACALLGVDLSISDLRGRFHPRGDVQVMPTYHPSFLLRQENERRYKAETWADLKQVMELLGLARHQPGERQ